MSASIENRRARHEYEIVATYEAGIMLTGPEVKSLRAGEGSIAEAYVAAEGRDLVLVNAYVAPYKASRVEQDSKRPRRLLLRRGEIDKILEEISRKGMTAVPLRLRFDERGRLKLELAVARGKKLHDKREDAKARDWQRQKARVMSEGRT